MICKTTKQFGTPKSVRPTRKGIAIELDLFEVRQPTELGRHAASDPAASEAHADDRRPSTVFDRKRDNAVDEASIE